MSNIYTPTDGITPMVSFHKSVTIDGGIIAKTASLGNSQYKLTVKEDGIYITVPCNFGDEGKLSATHYKAYNLGAMIEAIQELNRRTAWMEPEMTFGESLIGTDIPDNTAINPGAIHSATGDYLPGLKRTVPDGNNFKLVDTNGNAIRFYQITDEILTAILSPTDQSVNPELIDPLNTADTRLDTIRTIMTNDIDYANTYISPRILNDTNDSFELLVLDTVEDSSTYPTLSDAYYLYTPIDGKNEYKASLKPGVTFNDICTDDAEGSIKIVTPPVPYICTFSDATKRVDVTSIAELFKDRTIPAGKITLTNGKKVDILNDFSDWDFSEITDMSNIFEGCNRDFRVRWTHTEPMLPAFIYDQEPVPYYIEVDDNDNILMVGDIDMTPINTTGINLTNYIWKDNEGVWWRFSYTQNGNDKSFGKADDLLSFT